MGTFGWRRWGRRRTTTWRGVTWVQDAWVEPGDVDTYVEAARRGALRIRFNLGLYADPRHFDAQVGHFAEARRRDEVASPLLTARTVKFFADGVWRTRPARCSRRTVPGHTATEGCSEATGNNRGMQVWEGQSLAEAARRVDDLGLQIHVHAIGDAAVRQALDAIEYVAASTARATGGPSSRTRSSSTTRISTGSPGWASSPTCSRCGRRWMR